MAENKRVGSKDYRSIKKSDILNLTGEEINSLDKDSLQRYIARGLSISKFQMSHMIDMLDKYGMNDNYLTGKRFGTERTWAKTMKEISANYKNVRNSTQRSYLMQIKNFLSNKSSTFTGYMQIRQDFARRVSLEINPEASPFDIEQTSKEFFRLYNRFEEMYPTVKGEEYDSNNVMEAIADFFNSGFTTVNSDGTYSTKRYSDYDGNYADMIRDIESTLKSRWTEKQNEHSFTSNKNAFKILGNKYR